MIQVMKDAVHTLQVLQVCRLSGQTMAGDLHDDCRSVEMLWSDGARLGRRLQNLGPQNRDAQNHDSRNRSLRNRGPSAASLHYAESDDWPWESPSGLVIRFKRRQSGATSQRDGDIWRQRTTSFGGQDGGGEEHFSRRASVAAQQNPPQEHAGMKFMANTFPSATHSTHVCSPMGPAARGQSLSETTTKNDNTDPTAELAIP